MGDLWNEVLDNVEYTFEYHSFNEAFGMSVYENCT